MHPTDHLMEILTVNTIPEVKMVLVQYFKPL